MDRQFLSLLLHAGEQLDDGSGGSSWDSQNIPTILSKFVLFCRDPCGRVLGVGRNEECAMVRFSMAALPRREAAGFYMRWPRPRSTRSGLVH
jgi:hypothetical protein